MGHYIIHDLWDAEASVWVATSDDVPGLVTEAATIPELTGKLRVLIPELLEENDLPLPLRSEQRFRLIAECEEAFA